MWRHNSPVAAAAHFLYDKSRFHKYDNKNVPIVYKSINILVVIRSLIFSLPLFVSLYFSKFKGES